MTRGLAIGLCALVAACGGETAPSPTGLPVVDQAGLVPDLVCPGSPGCESADGVLRAGAAIRSITPAVETWTDDAGTELARYRFATDEFNYFETVLPRWPEKGVKYNFILTAGPDGYWTWQGNDLVLYEGDWAYGTASGRTQRKSYIWEAWGGGYQKYYYDAVEWTLNGFLMP